MTKLSETMSAREFVWVHRIRQRIALERIIMEIGNPLEQARSQQFLEAMHQANPELFEEIDDYIPELLENGGDQTLELFDASEYAPPKGRKTALKLPRDLEWEERVVRRGAREYTDLFHPCADHFGNAMKGLLFLHKVHPKLFAKARERASAQREQILTDDLYCKCGCTTLSNRRPAKSFAITKRGRFANVSGRIAKARLAMDAADGREKEYWQFFLDRIGEVAPELLES